MTEEIIKKYNIQKTMGGYKVSNHDAICAYLNNDFDWYATDFLNKKCDNDSLEIRKTKATRFIQGFIAEELAFSSLKNIYTEINNQSNSTTAWYDIQFTNPNSRYSYSRYCLENLNYTEPDFILCTKNKSALKIDCKYSSQQHLTEKMVQQSHGADGIVLTNINEDQAFLLFWKKIGDSWYKTDITFTKTFEYHNDQTMIDVTQNYTSLLCDIKKYRIKCSFKENTNTKT